MGKGTRLETGGHRVGNKGYFYEPTVVSDVPSGKSVGHVSEQVSAMSPV